MEFLFFQTQIKTIKFTEITELNTFNFLFIFGYKKFYDRIFEILIIYFLYVPQQPNGRKCLDLEIWTKKSTPKEPHGMKQRKSEITSRLEKQKQLDRSNIGPCPGLFLSPISVLRTETTLLRLQDSPV